MKDPYNKPMQSLLEDAGYRLSGYIDNLDFGDPELVYFKSLRRNVDGPAGDGIMAE